MNVWVGELTEDLQKNKKKQIPLSENTQNHLLINEGETLYLRVLVVVVVVLPSLVTVVVVVLKEKKSQTKMKT